MHHELRMCIRDRFADFANQFDARLNRRRMFRDVVQQRFAFYIFEHQKRRAEQASGINQARDAGVIEPCQHGALLRKPGLEALGVAFGTQELDRDLGLIQAIGARREPDFAHAADADDFLKFPGAAQFPGMTRVLGTRTFGAQGALQQTIKPALAAVAEHRRQLRGQPFARTPDDIRDQCLGMRPAEQLAHFVGQARIACMQRFDEIGA